MEAEEREIQRIEPGMDVCDVDGKKLGTVVDLRPVAGAPAGPGSPAGGQVMEVKTGFLGLGKHLYVPLDAVRDASEAGVFLRQRRDQLDTNAWERVPEMSAGAADVYTPASEVARPAAETAAAPEAGAPASGGQAAVPSTIGPAAAAAAAAPASSATAAPPAAAPATAAAQAPAQESAAVATAASAATAPSVTSPGMAPGTGSWETVVAHYRSRWEEHYGQQGATWESYEPRYRFAWEMGRSQEMAGRSWYAAQPSLREAWEAQQPDTSWEQVADTVRDAWEHPSGA